MPFSEELGTVGMSGVTVPSRVGYGLGFDRDKMVGSNYLLRTLVVGLALDEGAPLCHLIIHFSTFLKFLSSSMVGHRQAWVVQHQHIMRI